MKLQPDQLMGEPCLIQLGRGMDGLERELVSAARPLLRGLIWRHACRGERLEWLEGIWIGGRRGMVLTVKDKPVLFVAISPFEWTGETGLLSAASLTLNCREIEDANRG